MQLENQVCSLELAKKLKELGVKQENSFRWCYFSDDGKPFLRYCRLKNDHIEGKKED